MNIEIMQLDRKTNEFRKVHTLPSKEALEFHIKCMGLVLPESEIFDLACANGVLYVWEITYHADPDELRKEVEQILTGE